MGGLDSEVRDGMRTEGDVAIKMDDAAVLRANVFRPMHASPEHPAYVLLPFVLQVMKAKR
jgi:hypothetical protein